MEIPREQMPDGLQRVFDQIRDHGNIKSNSIQQVPEGSNKEDVYAVEFDDQTDPQGSRKVINNVNKRIEAYNISVVGMGVNRDEYDDNTVLIRISQ